jgi:hypothetical protein
VPGRRPGVGRPRVLLLAAACLLAFIAAAPSPAAAYTPQQLRDLRRANETAYFQVVQRALLGGLSTADFFTVFDTSLIEEDRIARGAAMAQSEEPPVDTPVEEPVDDPNNPPPPGTFEAVTSGPWTSRATWNSTRPPSPGSNITILPGVTVTLPTTLTLSLNTMWVLGQLRCGDLTGASKLALTVASLRVRGVSARLECGTLATPFRGNLTITLTGKQALCTTACYSCSSFTLACVHAGLHMRLRSAGG